MLKPKPLLTALLAALLPLSLNTAAQVTPNAGSILREVRPLEPQLPSPSGTGLEMEAGDTALPQTAPFPVQQLQISGNTLFDTATLHALVADAEGRSLTLVELGAISGRITAFYRARGYPLARAIIPAQTIRDGVVAIEVVEARYGDTVLDNHSKVRDSLLESTLAPLQLGEVIGGSELDRSLLLLSDIPGVAVNATLKPGQAVGTSDLLVTTSATPAISGQLVLDGYGNRYTGRERVGGTLNINNPLRHGDVISIDGLSSGSGLNYGRAGYESLLNGYGTRLGGAYSALSYELGEQLDVLDAHGTATVVSVWGRQPLLRSRSSNLYLQIQYDQLQLRDRIDTSSIRTDRHLDNWSAGLTGDARDALWAGGITLWNLGVTAGQVDFDDEVAQSIDTVSANSRGGFTRWNGNVARLQRLSSRNSLFLSLTAQWSDRNLDSSQKMSAGGPYSVRAYDTGAVSGDRGYLGTAEWRHDLGSAWAGQWQTVAFVDHAQVTVNQNPWVRGDNHIQLSGAGAGLSWFGANGFSARASVAAPIGARPQPVENSSATRFWIEAGKRF